MLAGNAAESIFNVSGKLPGHPSRNVAGLSIIPMLVDPIHRNFRPKGGSALASLGAGAYSLSGEYWIPGQQQYLPSHPVPAHCGIWRLPHSKSVELLWRSGYNANSNRLVVSRHLNGTKIESFQLNIAVADSKQIKLSGLELALAIPSDHIFANSDISAALLRSEDGERSRTGR